MSIGCDGVVAVVATPFEGIGYVTDTRPCVHVLLQGSILGRISWQHSVGLILV